MKVKPINIPDVYQLKVLFLGINPTIWRRIQIRVEKAVNLDHRKAYPCSIGGSRLGSYEECQGTQTFMALQQKY